MGAAVIVKICVGDIQTSLGRVIAIGGQLATELQRANQEKEGEPTLSGLALCAYKLETFAACRPLGPRVTSNSTAWPSLSDL